MASPKRTRAQIAFANDHVANHVERISRFNGKVRPFDHVRLERYAIALLEAISRAKDLSQKDKEWTLAPQYGRDMHRGRFVEAICPHGIGHHKGVHGCDGCCFDISKTPPPEDIWSQVTED